MKLVNFLKKEANRLGIYMQSVHNYQYDKIRHKNDILIYRYTIDITENNELKINELRRLIAERYPGTHKIFVSPYYSSFKLSLIVKMPVPVIPVMLTLSYVRNFYDLSLDGTFVHCLYYTDWSKNNLTKEYTLLKWAYVVAQLKDMGYERMSACRYLKETKITNPNI